MKDYDKPLVDHEGFPRPDIEFTKIAEFRNLKKELTSRCADCLTTSETE